MAEGSNSGEGGQATQTTTTQTTETTVKPEYVPDQFWNSQKGEVDVQGMATGFKDLSTRFAKGKEALVPEIKTEVMKEIFGKRPEKPDLYKFEIPKEGPVAEKLSKSSLVVLAEKPGMDFKPEQGKVYYSLNKDGPTFKLGQEIAHRAGMSNDEFVELAHKFGEIEMQKKTEAEKKTQDQLIENRKILGENADKRIEYVKGKLKALVGDKAPEVLDVDYLPASAIETIEALLEKAGEPKFSSGQGGAQQKDTTALQAEADELMKSKDYYESPAKQARIAEIFRQLAPGKAIAGNFRKRA